MEIMTKEQMAARIAQRREELARAEYQAGYVGAVGQAPIRVYSKYETGYVRGVHAGIVALYCGVDLSM